VTTHDHTGNAKEEAVDEQMDEGAIGRDAVLALEQPSVRRRDYELRRGDEVLGWLRFPAFGRSAAAWAGATGPLALTAGRGRVEVRGGPDAATVATVERARRGAVVRLAGGTTLRWRRTGPGNRWAIDHDGEPLLRFAARSGLLRSSVRVTAERQLPGPTAELLCLVGGFLALRSLHADLDDSAAVAGIVAAGAG
jgi:hypothetical protein